MRLGMTLEIATALGAIVGGFSAGLCGLHFGNVVCNFAVADGVLSGAG